MRLFRTDYLSELGKPEELPNGWLRVDGYISRTGIQTYERDGKPFLEYRPPDEVFAPDTIASFASVPVTKDHPSSGTLNAHNTKAYQVGTVESPRQDGQRTRARLLLTDAVAIEAMRKGKMQLSCGYMCDLDETPGVTPEGHRYDAIQRNIYGNHVALVDEARGGPELTVRIDSAGLLLDFQERVDVTSTTTSTTENESQGKYIMEELKKALEALAAEKVRADGLQAKLDATQAKLDATQAKADSLEVKVKAIPDEIRASIKARSELESKAREALGTSEKFDGKSDLEIKRMVISSRGTVKVDGKSEAYIDAAFDIACASEPREDSVSRVEDVTDSTDEVDPVAAAQARMQARFDAPFKRS